MSCIFSMPKKQENGIRLLEPMRDSLRALLGVPCFVRRSREEDALFATDALRRTDHPDALRARLADSGEWRAWERSGLLLIDPEAAAWTRLMAGFPSPTRLRPEDYPADPLLAAWALRICAESVAYEKQPVAPLRMTLKRLDAGETEQLLVELPAAVSVIQRSHRPLPEAAGRCILWVLDSLMGGK